MGKSKLFEKLRKAFNQLIEGITTKELSEKDLSDKLWDFQLALIEGDVAVPVAEEISNKVKEKLSGQKIKRFEDVTPLIKKTLRESLIELFSVSNPLDLVEKVKEKRAKGEPYVIVFFGVNGVGKTTTIAKLAKYFMDKGLSVVLACSDTFRAGAEEQLEFHAKRIGAKMIKHRYGADPAAVAYDAVAYARSKGINVVLIDTAGRMQTDRDLMDELKKIVKVIRPDLSVFVGDALTGNDAVDQAQKFMNDVGFDAVILTKVDADVRGGAAISIASVTRKPIIFLGVGQRYEDLIPFTPKWIIDKVVPD